MVSDPFFVADEEELYFNEKYLQNELKVMFSELNVEVTVSEIENAIKLVVFLGHASIVP